jgi:hypothetical protein
MRPTPAFVALLLFALSAPAPAQEASPPKRSWFGRIFHPSQKIPEYKDRRLRGLALSVQLPPQPIQLSQMRQLPLTIRLTNLGERPVELSFPSEQRIEIYLRDAAGRVVTRWSDNRAFADQPATVLVNPNEHLEYSETIATRDLAPNKVFTVEVFVPAYPELDVKRKALSAP